MTVRLLNLEQCCDYFTISGGPRGRPEFRYPRNYNNSTNAIPASAHGRYSQEINRFSNGVGDVLELTGSFFTLNITTDESVTGDGFELDIFPSERIRKRFQHVQSLFSPRTLISVLLYSSYTFVKFFSGRISDSEVQSNSECTSRPVMQENATLVSGSLRYRPSSEEQTLCIRRDWLYTLPSNSTASGYRVMIWWVFASKDAGSLTISPVGTGPVEPVRTFSGRERQSPRVLMSSHFIVLSRAMNVSLRATDYSSFSLVFVPHSSARDKRIF